VGPNGSGKSNVIDAMLFVFGKRASKLRLKKVSELIHKSDAVRDNPPSYARVSVYFQDIIDTGPGDEDYTPVPGSDRVVTRIARMDNSSTYKMDGKICQFKDVAAYLDSKGIDLDNNRFLILQGEVEMISMMPPKGKTEGDEGLLEYLEDIVGSSKYVQETEDAAVVVETLTEQRQEKLNRVKAVEKEKDALESAKQEAESLLKKDREIRSKQNILYQLHLMKTNTDLSKLGEKKSSVETKLASEREHLESSKARVQDLEDGLKKQKKEYDTTYAELVKTKEEFAAFERRDIKLREEIKHGKAQKKKLEAKIKQQSEKEVECQEKAVAAEESIPRLEQEIVTLTNLKAEEDSALEKVYDQMKSATQTLRVELEEKTQDLAPVNQERAVYQAALDTAMTEVQLLEEGVNRAKEKLLQAETELASLDQTQETKRIELAKAEDELVTSKERIVEAETEENLLAGEDVVLAKRYTQLMSLAEEAQATIQSNGGSRTSPAVQGILKAARTNGELSKAGVLGRLGDLATIADEYDVAVSTACGHLDHVIVQTTAGAQRCLEFLRKHNLGRANFIPLDKMKKGAHDRVVETPEGAPRLFDLINPIKPMIAPAIFLAVSDTLVAPDLETATRWAYDYNKRWRVVTVDGKLIEASGTMAGGGTSVRRGGMKLSSGRAKVSSDDEDVDIERLQEEVKKAHQTLQDCRDKRKVLVEEIRTLKKTVKVLETKIPKLSVEIGSCDTTREGLKKLIPELRTQSVLSAEDASKLVELNQKVGKCKSDMSSCALKASKLEAEVARLQKAIMDAGGSKLKKQNEACEKALQKLNATEKALNTAKVLISSMTKAVEKAQKVKAETETELEQCIAKSAELKAEFHSLEEDAVFVVERFNKAKEREAEDKEAYEAASKECEELKKSQSDVKCVEVELVGKLDDLVKQMSELEKKREKWEADLVKLRDASAEDDDCFDEEETEEENIVVDDAEEMNDTSEGSQDDVTMMDVERDTVLLDSKKAKPSKDALPTYTYEALDKYDKDDVLIDIQVLETERNAIAKNANMGAIAEYRKKEADYLSRYVSFDFIWHFPLLLARTHDIAYAYSVSELDMVTEERNAARRKHEDLRRLRLEMFMNGFGEITLKLKEMYQMITLGGDAELELVDSLDPFSEGIVFSVRPPKKSWKNISNLSGGEKTLSSLALVFALHHFKPTPLYVMDEIDAALDFKNVSIVANYIKERTRNAQFIIISLRNNMFELADRLVGIYKTNNCTKSVSINPRAFGIQGQLDGGDTTPSTPGLLVERRRNTAITTTPKLTNSLAT
jgi:structural maintenance of chromosome 4